MEWLGSKLHMICKTMGLTFGKGELDSILSYSKEMRIKTRWVLQKPKPEERQKANYNGLTVPCPSIMTWSRSVANGVCKDTPIGSREFCS